MKWRAQAFVPSSTPAHWFQTSVTVFAGIASDAVSLAKSCFARWFNKSARLLTASADQYASSPANRAYRYAELAVYSLAMTVLPSSVLTAPTHEELIRLRLPECMIKSAASFQPIIWGRGGANISYSTTSLSPCYCDVWYAVLSTIMTTVHTAIWACG